MQPELLLERVLETIHHWDHLGVRRMEDGSLWVGHLPEQGSLAWLHKVVGPAAPGKVEELERAFPEQVPGEYAGFLKMANGLYLFSRRICIHGIRTSYTRSASAPTQPYDVRTPNQEERVPGAPHDAFFVGSYGASGDLLAVLGSTGQAIRCSRDNAAPLQSWPSFAEMLTTELERYASLCDPKGRMAPETPGA